MYVLRRIEDGAFVAAPGLVHSYTHDLTLARTFSTKVRAEKDKCGNEVAIRAEDLMQSCQQEQGQ